MDTRYNVEVAADSTAVAVAARISLCCRPARVERQQGPLVPISLGSQADSLSMSSGTAAAY